MGPPGLFVEYVGEAVVCATDPRLHQEAREVARVRHTTDTHRAPLKTPLHDSTQSASNVNITRTVSQSQNITQPTLTNACPRRFTKSYKETGHHKVKP